MSGIISDILHGTREWRSQVPVAEAQVEPRVRGFLGTVRMTGISDTTPFLAGGLAFEGEES